MLCYDLSHDIVHEFLVMWDVEIFIDVFFKLWCCDVECIGCPCVLDTPVLLEGNLIFLDAEAFRGNDIDKVEKLVNAYDFKWDLIVTGRGNWFIPYWVVRATIARQHNSWRLNTKI